MAVVSIIQMIQVQYGMRLNQLVRQMGTGVVLIVMILVQGLLSIVVQVLFQVVYI